MKDRIFDFTLKSHKYNLYLDFKNTTMALTAYLSITGQKDGQISGGVKEKGKEGQIAVFAFHHETLSPRDPASGLATGKRLHKPIVITKELDKSSPLLYKLLCTNENLTEVIIRFWSPVLTAGIGTGQEVQNYTIKLTNAEICSIITDMADNKISDLNRLPVLEQVAFNYQKIEWIWTEGGITFMDEWKNSI